MTNCSSDGPEPYNPEPGTGTGATGNPGVPGEGTGASGNPGGGGTGVPGTGGGNNGGGPVGPVGPIDADADPPTPIQGGTLGHSTRYWDCCKLHCSWIDHAENSGMSTLSYCAADGRTMSKDTDREHQSESACDGGSAYACYNAIPRQAGTSGKLSYGYAAVKGGSGKCGACYQLEFNGKGHYNENDHGSKALQAQGKVMIVQATNIGYDVGANQFDIQIPGGGVGIFDACSKQWGNPGEMGKVSGGLLGACEDQLGWEATHAQLKECVRNRCDRLFTKPELSDLKEACHWFVDWFEVANNPQFMYQEVPCPSYFNQNWK